jgi:hypothetical protein
MTGRQHAVVTRAAVTLAASLTLAGCIIVPFPARHGTPTDAPGRDALRAADAQAAIVPGRTTLTDLAFAWGPPDHVRDNGTTAIWLGDVVDYRVGMVILIPGGGGASSEVSHRVAMAVRFDSRGVVERWEPLEGEACSFDRLEVWR